MAVNKWLWIAVGSLCLVSVHRDRAEGALALKSLDAKLARNLDLLEFAMHNDDSWRLVFDQKIKVTYENAPPYHGLDADNETRTRLRLLDEAATEIAPLPLIQNVLKNFPWLGSYVEYASYVLHTAFMCTTFELVLLQMDLILMLDRMTPDQEEIAGDTVVLADEAWLTVSVFMDKLGAVNGGMDIMAELSYQYTKLAAEKRKEQVHVLGLMRKQIESTVDGQCYRMDIGNVHGHLGVRDDFERLNGTEPTQQDIVDVFNKTSVGIMEIYNELNVKTMAFENWEQILDFQVPIKKNVNLYLKIENLLVNDPLGEQVLDGQRDG